MALAIRLERYDDYTVRVDPSRLRDLFPESVLVTTLDLDPTTEEINITLSTVTPVVLDIVEEMIRTGRPVPFNSSITKDQYITASNYLNMDILTAMTDPTWDLYLRSHPLGNLLVSDGTYFEDILYFGATTGSTTLIWYAFRNLEKASKEYVNLGSVFVLAAYYGNAEMVRLMLSRVDPSTAQFTQSIEYEDHYDPGDYGQYVMLSPTNSDSSILRNPLNQAIYFAVAHNHVSVTQVLLGDSRVGYNINSGQEDELPLMYYRIGDINNITLLEIMASNYRTNPGILTSSSTTIAHDPVRLAIILPYVDVTNYHFFWNVFNSSSTKPLRVYLLRDDFDLTAGIQYLYRPEEDVDIETYAEEASMSLAQYQILSADPRFDPNRLPDLLIRVLVFKKQLDILDLILQDSRLSASGRDRIMALVSP